MIEFNGELRRGQVALKLIGGGRFEVAVSEGADRSRSGSSVGGFVGLDGDDGEVGVPRLEFGDEFVDGLTVGVVDLVDRNREAGTYRDGPARAALVK